MKKKHLMLVVLALISCTIFGQNEVQKQLIGKWETVDENGKTYHLTITESQWSQTRAASFKRLHSSYYTGNYKFKNNKKIIITSKTEIKEIKRRVKIIKLDKHILVFKLIEKGHIFNIEKTVYSFKRI